MGQLGQLSTRACSSCTQKIFTLTACEGTIVPDASSLYMEVVKYVQVAIAVCSLETKES